jgi:hypothetical protein
MFFAESAEGAAPLQLISDSRFKISDTILKFEIWNHQSEIPISASLSAFRNPGCHHNSRMSITRFEASRLCVMGV